MHENNTNKYLSLLRLTPLGCAAREPCAHCSEERECVPAHGVGANTSAAGGATGAAAGSCTLQCGAGACEERAGAARCRCPPQFAGERCQHYRCAQHCHRRGRCELAEPTQPATADALPPLKCVCQAGYTGERCERPAAPGACAALACLHNATCALRDGRAACECPPHYAGERCERCLPGADCAPDDICRFFCLNQGTCSVSAVDAVSCACPPAWSGERCQRPACVDAACASPPAPHPAPHPAPTHNHTDDREYTLVSSFLHVIAYLHSNQIIHYMINRHDGVMTCARRLAGAGCEKLKIDLSGVHLERPMSSSGLR
ncbi:hypothetical protein B5X24_HaOG203213 [Helicoverpa armigera]|uniref:EGF-like domain-containing protein n=1 Tax=Helicoverpa armigera TaxID=29058 RepID=A0A2W1BXP8_HELAM|nr:hypothetical protein B5X24_HaOG203213 [Helicoverpa armigera]